MEFDHLFICCPLEAPEVDAILSLGLTEGSSNHHPGQGTANRRIFFRNAMLEFLWVENQTEVRSPMIAPTQLWERWNYPQTKFSPFGIALRLAENSLTLPNTWAYRPPYLPDHLQIDVASDTQIREPMIFVIPFGKRPDQLPVERRQPLEHACGFCEITQITLTIPGDDLWSPSVQILNDLDGVEIRAGSEHLVEVEFDQGQQQQYRDFCPQLPLRLIW